MTLHFIIFAGEGSTSTAAVTQVAASTSSLVGEDDAGGALGSSSDPEHSSSLSGDLIHRDRELDINDIPVCGGKHPRQGVDRR